jgi:hypothetical protein
VAAKKAIKMQVKETIHLLAALEVVVAPTIAMINWVILIPVAPLRRRARRPRYSTRKMPGTVEPTLTMLVANVIRNSLLIPEFLKKVVP